jgi:glucokinase
MDNHQLAIGVDLGATKIASALVNDQGKVLARHRVLTNAKDGVQSVIRRLAYEVQYLAALAPGQVTGIGIGVPGFVDPARGVVIDATNLSWFQVPLLSELKKSLELDLPLSVQMDSFASTLGEYYFGAARGCQDMVYLSIGSGISAGLIAGGKLITGTRNLAGQCGYYSLWQDSKDFGANGPQDTAEEILSGYGLLALTRRLLAEGRLATYITDTPKLSTLDILDAARQGDPLARAVMEEAGTILSMLLSAYLSFLNPAAVVIGGGLGTAAFDLLVPVALEQLKKRVIDVYYSDLMIVPSGQVSSAQGAACLVFRQTLPDRFSL